MKAIITFVMSGALAAMFWGLSGCVVAESEATHVHGPESKQPMGKGCQRPCPCDQELATLLVKLELRTRAVIAKHYVAADEVQRAWLAENLLLPAAVADGVFHEVVPTVTADRAWVKMVVDKPRNPHNAGDATALALLDEVRDGKPSANRSTSQGFYYAEPIKAAKTCLRCHGSPKGEPDPFFPQYLKDGWREGQIVGAVVARVAPAT